MTYNWRVIAAAVAAVFVFVMGWTVRGWIADAAMSETLLSFEKERVERIEAANRAIAAAEQHGRDVTVKYESTKRDLLNVSQKLKTEVLHAHNQAIKSAVPVCNLAPEWVRIYDDALRPTSDSSASAGVASDPSAGAGNPETGNGASPPVSEWDVLWVHTENASRWAACRSQLNALIDFETGDGASVVTQESRK